MKSILLSKIRQITALVFLAYYIMLVGCDANFVYEVNKPLKAEKWSYADTQIFEAEIKDTAVHYNIFINLRHSFHFEWRNVWVNIETQFPDGKKYSKRVNLLLSEADGKWFGECTGDNCDIQIPIQENAIFPQQGIYKFSIAQDMRVNPLVNIRSVGMKVEKYTAESN